MPKESKLPAKKLIAFGDVNVDLVTEIPSTQSAGEVAPQPEACLSGGGTIGNTATGTARLGIETVFAGKIGRDGYGRFLLDGFKADGVDTSFLAVDPDEYTVMVLAFIDASGDKHNVTFPRTGGAHFKIRTDEIEPAVWNGAGWFHTSGISLGEDPCRTTALELMREARKRGLTVSFDLNLRLEYFGWRPHVKEAVLSAMALSDVVFASVDEELLPLTGTADVHAAVEKLQMLYPALPGCVSADQQVIIARNGGAPAIVYDHGKMFRSPCFKVDIVDTLGAGDAFNAGFIAARLNGKNLTDSLAWAHGTAGFNLTKTGARGMPTLQELEAFIAAHHLRL